jgi:glycosyltransferase involved in cell wall biosynthesis
LKVLHVNYYDVKGGAAKAASRLHHGMLNAGIDSQMLVIGKKSADDTVIMAWGHWLQAALYFKQHLELILLKMQKTANIMPHSLNLFASGLDKQINALKPDIVNIHWIAGAMLSFRELANINAPIVWTLHDSWAYTGTEHYHLNGCVRFRDGYTADNRMPGDSGLDIDRWIWRQKRLAWQNLQLAAVGPSQWITDEAKASVLLKAKNVVNIHNGLDLETFKPADRTAARRRLGLPPERKIVMFGAFSLNDSNKGGSELFKIIDLLKKTYQEPFELLLMGNKSTEYAFDGINVNCTGYLEKDEDIAAVYAAADVFILPSKLDNLPNMLVEAIACGVPCVAFNTGGIPDIITHKFNGWLAEAFNCEDFACGIKWALAGENHPDLACNARNQALNKFEITGAVKNYLRLYESLSNTRTGL